MFATIEWLSAITVKNWPEGVSEMTQLFSFQGLGTGATPGFKMEGSLVGRTTLTEFLRNGK